MRRISAIAFMTLLAAPSFGRLLDRTLATVNGEAILQSEFEKNATPILEQFKGAPPEKVKEIKQKVLDQMVDDRLLLHEAKSRNIHVSKLEVDDGVKRVRTRFNTDEEFNKELQKDGLNYEEFRKHIQDQIMVIKLIDQEVKAKVPPPAEPDAHELYDTLTSIIHDKPLPAGKTASELDDLRHLARMLEHQFGETVRARHILIKFPPNPTEADKAEAMKKIKEVHAKVKKGDDFADLAKKYSDDPGSKDQGGELPPFVRGDMVEPFEKAAFGMQVGQVSDIVTTQYGYHLIQVEERRAARKMSFDEVKNDLREILFEQRAAKRLESYLKDLRSKAEIKINSTDQ